MVWCMTTKLQICNAALIRCGAEAITAITDQNKRAITLNNQYDITLKEMLNDTPWNFATSREIRLTKSTAPAFGYANSYTIPSSVIRILETSIADDFRVEKNGIVVTDYDDLSASISITRVGATATVTHTAHGYNDQESILISGCTQTEYNGVFTITVVDANTYTYTVTGAPATPATGTPLAVRDAAAFRVKAIVLVDETYMTPSFIKAFVLKLAEDISYALVQSAALQAGIIAEAERYLRRARSYNSQEGTAPSRYPESYTSGLRL